MNRIIKSWEADTYQDAERMIRQLGILPLARLFPEHPSLDQITPKKNWFTGSELDPWQWRTRFSLEGKAAYGKIIKKKALLISPQLYAPLHCLIGGHLHPEELFDQGRMSQTAVDLYEWIVHEEGIDSRKLRKESRMSAKESKKAFDQALLELQAHGSIVIAGVRPQINREGEAYGWNSSSYESADHWMKRHGIPPFRSHAEEARAAITAQLQPVWTAKALDTLLKWLP
ncbi:hypothetical protein Q5741_05635 [Paenibacillus sp. JX-17]|uniref:Uncharacterized protein n=1 Tax=Paenibacillus lacisoli TaxID=3064525 RepID=A0ABT9C9F6_9BACL|nr:hypothetical protein [Paenibacillus sp. JX-17]MDO7905898.1 hypothetical protein [Paenibacillus sp. JX-17]